MFMSRILKSMRARFLALGLLGCVVLAIVAGVFSERNVDRTRNEVIAGESTLSTTATNALTNWINTNFRTIQNISTMPEIISQKDPQQIDQILGIARTYRPELTGVFLTDADGRLVGESGIDASLALPVIDAQLATMISTGRDTLIGPVELQADQPVSVMILLTPVMNVAETQSQGATTTRKNVDSSMPTPPSTPASTTTLPPGTVLGVVGSIIQRDNLSQTVIPTGVRPRTELTVLSDQQIIMSNIDLEPRGAFLLDLLARAINDDDAASGNVFNFTNENGNQRIATVTQVPIESADWYVLVTSPRPIDRFTDLSPTNIAAYAIGATLILIVSLVLGEWSTRQLQHVRVRTESLGSGDLTTPIEADGQSDVGLIGSAVESIRHTMRDQAHKLERGAIERRQHAEQMRDLLRRDIRLQEEERRRIAGEIHDAVSPLITGALYQNRALQMRSDEWDKGHDATLDDVSRLLENASVELHDIIFDLRPPDLDDLGIVAAIEAYVATIQRSGLSIRLEIVDDPPPLSPEVRLGLYRIVQEAVHNVLRHARADDAVVRLETDEHLLRVTIRDNGAGFDPEAVRRPTSLGLLSMRERAEAIGARFTILSKPGNGTAIIIEREISANVMSDPDFAEMLSKRGGNGHHEDAPESTEDDGSTVTNAPSETSF